MATARASNEVTVWTDARSAAAVEKILTRLHKLVRPIGIGGARLGDVTELGQRCGCPAGDDLRKLLVDCPAAFLLLTTSEGVRSEDIAAAMQQGTVVLATEPVVSELHELATLKLRPGRRREQVPDEAAPARAGGNAATYRRSADGRGGSSGNMTILRGSAVPTIDNGGTHLCIPRFRSSPGWISATDPPHDIGAVSLIQFTAFGRAEDQSLFARLYDAWDVVLEFTALPLQIDAACNSPMGDVPDDLRALRGGMVAMARLADQAVASITVSDQHATRCRRLYALGDEGQISVGDGDYRHFDEQGNVLDARRGGRGASFVELAARQWRDLIRHHGHLPRSHEQTLARDAQILACCHAALLSARTQEPESPSRMLQMYQGN